MREATSASIWAYSASKKSDARGSNIDKKAKDESNLLTLETFQLNVSLDKRHLQLEPTLCFP